MLSLVLHGKLQMHESVDSLLHWLTPSSPSMQACLVGLVLNCMYTNCCFSFAWFTTNVFACIPQLLMDPVICLKVVSVIFPCMSRSGVRLLPVGKSYETMVNTTLMPKPDRHFLVAIATVHHLALWFWGSVLCPLYLQGSNTAKFVCIVYLY